MAQVLIRNRNRLYKPDTLGKPWRGILLPGRVHHGAFGGAQKRITGWRVALERTAGLIIHPTLGDGSMVQVFPPKTNTD